MIDREHYSPGPAGGAQIEKDGENWMLVLVRELRHPPEKVWQALTDPANLREWAPFEADTNLGTAGVIVKLTTVGAPTRQSAGKPIDGDDRNAACDPSRHQPGGGLHHVQHRTGTGLQATAERTQHFDRRVAADLDDVLGWGDG